MEKILNQIKRLLFRILNDEKHIKGNEYDRGRLAVAKQIADVIDPINKDNIKPNNNVDDGEILCQFKSAAKPMNKFGFGGYVFGLQTENNTVLIGDIPWEEEIFNDIEYEIIIKKIGKIEQKPIKKAARRAKKDNVEDIYEQYKQYIANIGEAAREEPHIEVKPFNLFGIG